jgi:DNA-binding transcriptional LysR family regulator
MELRRLRLLDELARRGTVTAVAEALSYSPSSVSVGLHELEREAGAALLRRAGRNVELTPAGHRLAAYAATALAADEAILAQLATADDRPRGRLRMTMVGTPALALLPNTMARLEQRAPDLHVEVYDIETVPALEQLESRSVDLVVGVEYDPQPVPRQRSIDRHDLLREDMLLALHPSHPALAYDGPVSLADLKHSHWATGHRGTGLDALVRNRCNLLGGYEPEVRHRSNAGYVLGAIVASGLAVSLLPMLFTNTQPQIAARPVAEDRLQRTIFTAVRTSSDTPAVHAVRGALRETALSIAAEHTEIDVVG